MIYLFIKLGMRCLLSRMSFHEDSKDPELLIVRVLTIRRKWLHWLVINTTTERQCSMIYFFIKLGMRCLLSDEFSWSSRVLWTPHCTDNRTWMVTLVSYQHNNREAVFHNLSILSNWTWDVYCLMSFHEDPKILYTLIVLTIGREWLFTMNTKKKGNITRFIYLSNWTEAEVFTLWDMFSWRSKDPLPLIVLTIGRKWLFTMNTKKKGKITRLNCTFFIVWDVFSWSSIGSWSRRCTGSQTRRGSHDHGLQNRPQSKRKTCSTRLQ